MDGYLLVKQSEVQKEMIELVKRCLFQVMAQGLQFMVLVVILGCINFAHLLVPGNNLVKSFYLNHPS